MRFTVRGYLIVQSSQFIVSPPKLTTHLIVTLTHYETHYEAAS